MAVRHVVLFDMSLEADDPKAHEIIGKLNALPLHIDEIKTWTIQTDLGERDASHRYALIADFDSMDAVNAYLEHPEHVRVVDEAAPFITRLAEHDHEM